MRKVKFMVWDKENECWNKMVSIRCENGFHKHCNDFECGCPCHKSKQEIETPC